MRITVGDKARMEGTDHVMVDGNGVKSRFNGWRRCVYTTAEISRGSHRRPRIAGTRSGGAEVLRLHENAQGFVAAVFADSSIG